MSKQPPAKQHRPNKPAKPSRPQRPSPSQGQPPRQPSQPASQSSIRLNKFLAERLGLSRREADDAIAAGQVTINGKQAVLGARIEASSTGDADGGGPLRSRSDAGEEKAAGPVESLEIRYKGKIVPTTTEYIYLAFHKPVGYVCSRRAQGDAPTIYDLLPEEYRKLKTVGRLDRDSSGLILLTNDGDFAYQHTHPKFAKEKLYEVELNQPLQPLHQQMISDYGVMLDDGPSRFMVIKNPAGIEGERSASLTYLVILREGRNRQIRRTFAALGYRVTRLHRIQFGKYQLGALEPGHYQLFTP